jgi:hypothetical protein
LKSGNRITSNPKSKIKQKERAIVQKKSKVDKKKKKGIFGEPDMNARTSW